MGITGIQLAQNCLDHPGIGINGISVTDGPLHNVCCLIYMCALSYCQYTYLHEILSV
jgi:hypothetical protein